MPSAGSGKLHFATAKEAQMSDLFDADVNYLAVILGAIAVQPLGFLWYSTLFGKRWMAVRGHSRCFAGRTPLQRLGPPP